MAVGDATVYGLAAACDVQRGGQAGDQVQAYRVVL